jgi:outer membrane protein TolC
VAAVIAPLRAALARAGLRSLASISALALLAGCYPHTRTPPGRRAIAIYQETMRRAARPEPAASVPATLTADQAVEIVMRRSARVRAANAQAAAVEATADEEGQMENPELRIQNVRLDQVLDREPRVDVALRVSPPRPGELEAKTAQARAEGNEARAEAVLEAHTEELEVRLLFTDVLLYDAEIEAADAASASQRRLLALIKTRTEKALSTRLEEVTAELEALETERERAVLKADRDIAFGALMDRLGFPEDAPVRLVGDTRELAILPELPDEEAAILHALKNRPELAAASARIDAAEADIYAEKALQWPWLSFFEVGYNFAPRIPEPLGWSFGAGVELPLFSLNNGAIQRAEADRTAAKRLLEAEVERVVLEVRARLREARVARDLVRAHAKDHAPAAERATAEAQRAIDAAQVDALELEAIEEKRLEVAMAKLELLRRFYTALAELSVAVGGKLPAARSAKR